MEKIEYIHDLKDFFTRGRDILNASEKEIIELEEAVKLAFNNTKEGIEKLWNKKTIESRGNSVSYSIDYGGLLKRRTDDEDSDCFFECASSKLSGESVIELTFDEIRTLIEYISHNEKKIDHLNDLLDRFSRNNYVEFLKGVVSN